MDENFGFAMKGLCGAFMLATRNFRALIHKPYITKIYYIINKIYIKGNFLMVDKKTNIM